MITLLNLRAPVFQINASLSLALEMLESNILQLDLGKISINLSELFFFLRKQEIDSPRKSNRSIVSD